MKKIKLFKLLCFFMIILLDIIIIAWLVLQKEKILFERWPDHILFSIIKWIFMINFVFFFMGILIYISFKITKGSEMIYKDPSKEKKFENVYISESISNLKYCRGYKTTSYFVDWFFKTSLLFIFIPSIISFIISIIIKCNWLIYISLRISFFCFFCFFIYAFCTFCSNFWVLYVKFFKWLGFSWFEKDFNRTIAKNNYFPISVFYYEKQKQKQKEKEKMYKK